MTEDRNQILSVAAQTADGITVIRVGGEVDLVSGPRLAHEIKQAAADDGIGEIVVDLEDVTFLDSSGIAVLLTGHREAAAKDVGYRVRAARGIVREVLIMTGVWGELSQGDNP